jgi:hypothetical protein
MLVLKTSMGEAIQFLLKGCISSTVWSVPSVLQVIRKLTSKQNLLRQSLFYNYEYYHSRGEEAFSDPEEVQR